MFFHESDILLKQLPEFSKEIAALDTFLASLEMEEQQQLDPEVIAQILGYSKAVIEHIFSTYTEIGLIHERLFLWCSKQQGIVHELTQSLEGISEWFCDLCGVDHSFTSTNIVKRYRIVSFPNKVATFDEPKFTSFCCGKPMKATKKGDRVCFMCTTGQHGRWFTISEKPLGLSTCSCWSGEGELEAADLGAVRLYECKRCGARYVVFVDGAKIEAEIEGINADEVAKVGKETISGLWDRIHDYSSTKRKIGSPFHQDVKSFVNRVTGAVKDSHNVHKVISILFLAADPTDASRLRLGEEMREIREKLRMAKLRNRFKLEQRMSVRPADVSQALLEVQPQIVHFSGHGMAKGALCFENQLGATHPVQPDAVAALFEQFANQVHCVVLNACFSKIQATALARHIDYVIGMNQEISDKAAIAFAVGFYQALGAGRAIEEAYKLGCAQIGLQDLSEHLTPVLIKKG